MIPHRPATLPAAASGWQYKGWPRTSGPSDIEALTKTRPNLFTDDFMFPVAAISASDLDHNLATVSRFCDEAGISLAPHGKTTLSPEIIRRQLDAGAWAITAATANHGRILRSFGVERVLIAHQLVDPAGVRWAFDELSSDPRAEILCLVDSTEGIEQMERALGGRPGGRPIDVLVELGIRGGRTGCRDIERAAEVAARAAASPRLRLVGVEAFEGIIHDGEGSAAAVDALMISLRDLAERLEAESLFDGLDEVIVSAGGSMHTDRVVAVLTGAWTLPRRVRVVIRPGCYVTHDSRLYEQSAPFGVRPPMDAYPRLRPAFTVWSYVVSRPEPGLALLGFGKFDASHDVHLPTPLLLRRRDRRSPVERPAGSSPRVQRLNGELEVFEMNDQHAFVRVPEGFDLRVGDIVGCGISHPCTTFDRWRVIPVVDDDCNVVAAVRTYF